MRHSIRVADLHGFTKAKASCDAPALAATLDALLANASGYVCAGGSLEVSSDPPDQTAVKRLYSVTYKQTGEPFSAETAAVEGAALCDVLVSLLRAGKSIVEVRRGVD